MKNLEGKVALITGGNSGIGLATAKELLARRAKTVIITGRDQEGLDKAVKELGPNAKSIHSDSAEIKDINKLAQAVKAITPKLDIVYINAGIAAFLPLEHITEPHYEEIFNTNVKGVLFTVQQLLPLINDGGSIVLCSTAAVQKGVPGASVYVASKAALLGFVKSWAQELAERKIRVNSINPGFTNTPLFDKIGLTEEQKKGAVEMYASGVLLKRFAHAEEIAKGVAFLASDDSLYITGSDLLVDGGYTIS